MISLNLLSVAQTSIMIQVKVFDNKLTIFQCNMNYVVVSILYVRNIALSKDLLNLPKELIDLRSSYSVIIISV